jgi:hypothetical protein
LVLPEGAASAAVKREKMVRNFILMGVFYVVVVEERG